MLQKIFPFLAWFKDMNKSSISADLIAGITVALVLIPQSMAYAQLAGLPAYYGLYAAFLPPMVAALFGSSRQLATGPVAVVSLMSAASLEPLATAGGEMFIAYSILLAFIVGVFQFLLGSLRLGVVVNFLAHPVVTGFTNAAAIIIATSQLSKIFGVYVDKAEHHYETIRRVIEAAMDFVHWPTFALAALAFIVMFVLKKKAPKVPNVLVAVVLTTLISFFMGFQNNESIKISQINSDKVITSIGYFNKTITFIEDMSNERSELSTELIEMKKDDHATKKDIFELQRKIDRLNLKIIEEKEESHFYRSEIRHYKLEKGEGESGFFIKGEMPEGKGSNHNIWRIKVKNNILDEKELLLMGGGDVVGTVPSGLPAIKAPHFDWSIIPGLITTAIIISILGFMEAISIAKAMAAKTGQRLNPNQELKGQGIANMVGSFTSSYTCSGSFSRSAVNIDAGAVSGMSSVFTSIVVVITLLFLTPLLYHLPQGVLAAVIMMAVFGLINVKSVIHAWKAQRFDGIVAIVTFITTLAFAPHLDKGIMIGFLLSIFFHLYRTMKPRVASLSSKISHHNDVVTARLKDEDMYDLDSCKHISIVRFDGSLIFANVTYLEDKILDILAEKPELNSLIFVGDGINDLDASGEEMLESIINRLKENNINIYFAGLKEQITDVLKRTGLYEKIGEENMYKTKTQALVDMYSKAHEGSDEAFCPLKKLVYYKGFDIAKKSRVLLIDSEEDMKHMLAENLNIKDATTDMALSVIEKDRPDIVVFDIGEHEIDGVSILRKIKKEYPAIEVIIMTPRPNKEKQDEAIKLGVFACIIKPAKVKEIINTVEQAYKHIVSKRNK